MFTPDFERFCSLARQGNLIPVYREHLADMETPVSAFSRFAEDDYAFLLESVEGGERWGRYSFIGLHPTRIFTVENGEGILRDPANPSEARTVGEGFSSLKELMAEYTPVPLPELPPFYGGAVGYIGYENVTEFEPLPSPKTPLSKPTTALMFTDELAIFDNVRHTVSVVVCVHIDKYDSLEAAYEDACERIRGIESRLQQPEEQRHSSPAPIPDTDIDLTANMDSKNFCELVRKASDYILSGDVIQVVLSQRFTAAPPASPLSIYRALRLINPSPYTFFLKFGDRCLVGSSPEVMVRLTGNTAHLRPIAGTRQRGGTEQEDRQLADDLLADEKERAEHVMLVDLGRNDLGRVATPGSVQTRRFMAIERYSHVMHIVSDIEAVLQKDKDAFDLLKATFPAGTLTGAPKIRAMEIIHELEPESRGPYGGAVGYIGYDGNMDTAITIRTILLDDGTLSVQAGAGIVADSDPESEYQETINKAQGMVKALKLAANNLDLNALK